MNTEVAFKIVDVDGEAWYELTKPLVCLQTGIQSYNFRNEVINLAIDGCLILSKGFWWDGRSGPALDTVNTLRSSAFHDALYELIIIAVLPKSVRVLADILMRKIDKEDGVNFIRRWYSHVGLRLFGRGKKKRDYVERKIIREAG